MAHLLFALNNMTHNKYGKSIIKWHIIKYSETVMILFYKYYLINLNTKVCRHFL